MGSFLCPIKTEKDWLAVCAGYCCKATYGFVIDIAGQLVVFLYYRFVLGEDTLGIDMGISG